MTEQPGLFPGMKIEPVKQQQLTQLPAKAQVSNLPLFTGKPDRIQWKNEPVSARFDYRTGTKPN
jgi:hypothetical protein